MYKRQPHINELKDNTGRLILTPHIKEFSRLSGLDTDYILRHKLSCAKDFSVKYGVHVPVSYTHLDVYKRQQLHRGKAIRVS